MAETDTGELLREHRLRVTPQRRAILEAFRGSPDEHLSADDVLSRASVPVPDIGRGTVYATLAELTELGLIAAVGSPEPVRYELNTEPHDHFRCRLCLRLFDVEFGGRRLAEKPLSGYKVEAVSVKVEGICAQCRNYERGLRAGANAIKREPAIASGAIGKLACALRDSPLGALALASSASGIVRVAFEDHADFEGLSDRARSRRGSAAARKRLDQLGSGIRSYFGGRREGMLDEIDWRSVEPAVVEVLEFTRDIPFAEPLSYDRLGSTISAYRCGYAMGSNPVPLLLPCHRVSCGSYRPRDYVGGPERLKLLQALEAR
jgi:Fe2+ or Zn2+ uptake regulation protein/O6-methylguanine-DNA--protein-cysteine methyltransferase